MVFNNSILLGAGGQTTGQAPFDTTLIGNSAWYDGSSDYMNSPSFSAQADPTCFIFATWVQLLDFSIGSLGQYLWAAERSSNYASIRISDSNKLIAYSNPAQFESSMLFRDIGWYHIICSYKGPDDTIKMFVNGNEITVTKSNSNALASNLEPVHAAHTQRIGAYYVGATGGTLATAKNYMAQTVFLDGFSFQDGDVTISDFLDTYTFGTNGSQFIPKKNSDLATLAGTAGANSYVIDYADGSNLGNDISSKNNNFTLVSMDSENQSVHTPSLQFPILNALNGDSSLISNLQYGNRLGIGTSNWDSVFATKSMGKSGKYYYETRIHLKTGSNGFPSGIHEESTTSKNWANYIGNTTSTYGLGYALYGSGSYYTNGTENNTLGASTFSTGDIINMAVDLDNNKIWWGLNGTYFASGNPSTNTNGVSIQADTEYVFGISPSISDDYFVNFGQDSTFGGETTAGNNTDANGVGDFKYTVPTGFQCLASSSLTAPDFQGIDYFDATIYEGNGQNQRVGDFVPFTDTYTVDKSAMFDDGDRRYLARTYTASDTARSSNSQATISYWIKFCSNGANQDILTTSNSGQTLRLRHYINDQAGQESIYMTLDGPSSNRDFEIPISKLSEQEWTNIVYNIDVDNSTAADKIKCWVNGVQQTSTDTSYQSASNADYFLFDNEEHFIGNLAPASAGYTVFCLNSYLAEMHVLDGQLKPPTDFGQVDTSTNRWVAKDYKTNVGAYGNRGFYMAFDSTFASGNGAGTDSSGNGFNFTESFVSGGSAWADSDQFTDTPSKNFDVLGGAQVGGTISEGNTKAALGTGGNQIRSNFNLNAGKWYVESDIQATNNSASIGLVPSRSATFSNGPGRDANGGISYETDGDVFSDNVQNATAEASFAAGDVVQMAIDMDAKKVYFGKNNTFGGNPSAGTGGHFLPASILSDGAALITLGNYSGSQSSTQQINYGQFLNFDGGSTTNGFKFTPPTGFKAVNQDNLDDTASKITAWAWIKNKETSDNHMLFDRVRGVGEDLQLFASSTVAEATDADTLQRFLQRGAQIGNDAKVNTANESYVLWQWLLGDSATTGSTNDSGSINSTVIVADAGHFSVGTFTGAGGSSTIGHGLSAAPEFFLVKRIGTSGTGWFIYSKDTTDPNNKFLRLQTNAAEASASGAWTPGATTMGLNESSLNGINTSSVEHLFIALRSVPGVCKVGSFTGNFDHNGPYIHLGFKPSWYMTKDITTTSSWYIYDSANYPFNSTSVFHILANSNSSGGSGAFNEQDFLSDGVKNRGQNNDTNQSGSTFLYIAMAEIGGNGTLPPIYSR